MELRPTNNTTNLRAPTDDFGQATVGQSKEDSSQQGSGPETSAKAHYRSDMDSSQQALHHSIGTGRNQASPGSHIHDGGTSNKLGEMVFDTTVGQEGKTIPMLSISGSRGGNAAVASMIALLKNFINFNDNTTA